MLKVRMMVLSVVVGLAALLGVSAANATSYIDGSVAGAFTQFQADAATLAGLAFPVVLFILGTFIAWRLVKKFGNKI